MSTAIDVSALHENIYQAAKVLPGIVPTTVHKLFVAQDVEHLAELTQVPGDRALDRLAATGRGG